MAIERIIAVIKGLPHIFKALFSSKAEPAELQTEPVAQPELGKVYKGKVIKVLEFGAFVSLLPGINGLLPNSEISHKPVKNVNDHLRLGQLIKAKVIEIDGRHLVLSIKALGSSVREQPELGMVYEGKVKNIFDDGALVTLRPGIYGLLPKWEISRGFVDDPHYHLQKGQLIKAKVIKIIDKGSVRLSMKALDNSVRELPELPEHGKVYEGRVSKILESGAYVSLSPGIKGMLRKSNISHDPVENINDHLRLGQLIKVKVVKIKDGRKVYLSMKALVERMQPVLGKVYEGNVTAITSFGAYVRLPHGRTGLLRKSEIAHKPVENVKDYLQFGQLIKVKVIRINEGKSHLSIKAIDSSEPEQPELGKVYEGKV